MTTREPIGIVGLGLLGSALAERLLAAGFPIRGYDVDTSRCTALESLGGQSVEEPTKVTDDCQTILLSLPHSGISGDVLEHIRPGLNVGDIVVDTTTGDPGEMEALGRLLEQHQVDYLDATVGGSSDQARQREVTVMVGGRREAFDACRDVWHAFAKEAFHVGPSGSGARMKLVVNLVLGLNRAALAEGLALARAFELDIAHTLQVLTAGPAQSRAIETKGRKMLDEDFTPQARLSQHLKDVRLILSEGDRLGRDLPLSKLHARLLEEVETAGHGDLDNCAVIKAWQ
jgi:3-hydroxyisobutyrate dehydrogenase-like beta-hydroxyacid dehydrogenase